MYDCVRREKERVLTMPYIFISYSIIVVVFITDVSNAITVSITLTAVWDLWTVVL